MTKLLTVIMLLSSILTASGQSRTYGAGKVMRILSFNVREWTRDTDDKAPTYWKTRMEAMERMINDYPWLSNT